MKLPLDGVKVVELAGLAPAPFVGMVLADFGAEVVRVDRIAESNPDVLVRGKKSISVSLKSREGQEIVRALAQRADVLIEPFRPGVMERLQLGPESLIEGKQGNKRLVYARMTGFGQSGPWSSRAGHDINYLALSGALALFGPCDRPPTPPANILGDFGGAAFCVLGILLALLARERNGQGQVIDANIVHSSTYLTAFVLLSKMSSNPVNRYAWEGSRGQNLLDGGSPMYRCYETKDGAFVSVGALEPQFYAQLLLGLGLEETDVPDRLDRQAWPALTERFTVEFKKRTRDEWDQHFSQAHLSDACVAPVLTSEEIVGDLTASEAARRRSISSESAKLRRAPLLSSCTINEANEGSLAAAELVPGSHTHEILQRLNFSQGAVQSLIRRGIVYSSQTQTSKI